MKANLKNRLLFWLGSWCMKGRVNVLAKKAKTHVRRKGPKPMWGPWLYGGLDQLFFELIKVNTPSLSLPSYNLTLIIATRFKHPLEWFVKQRSLTLYINHKNEFSFIAMDQSDDNKCLKIDTYYHFKLNTRSKFDLIYIKELITS